MTTDWKNSEARRKLVEVGAHRTLAVLDARDEAIERKATRLAKAVTFVILTVWRAAIIATMVKVWWF